MSKPRESSRKASGLKPLVSLPLAEADDAGRFGVEGGLASEPVYVEDRLVGREQWPSGLLLGNMRLIASRSAHDGSRTAMCRLVARQFFQRPIAAARWRFVEPVALDRAKKNGTTLRQEVAEATCQAIALIDLSEVHSSPADSFERIVSRRINDLVTEDFLGPEWRHRIGQGKRLPREVDEADGAQATTQSDEERILNRQYGAGLIAKAMLSPREAEVLRAVAEGYRVEEWARSVGIKASGARTAYMRARRKISRATG